MKYKLGSRRGLPSWKYKAIPCQPDVDKNFFELAAYKAAP